MDNVEQFIRRRFKTDCNWLKENSYYFAIMLKDHFKRGTIVYDDIEERFLLYLYGYLYDYKGKHEVNHRGHLYVNWNKFDEYDILKKGYIEHKYID